MPGHPSSPAGAAQCYHPPRCAQKPLPSRGGGCGEAGQGSGDSANRSRWDGNGDEIRTQWVWVRVRVREEDVKRVEWDRNGVGMKGRGSEWG